MTTLYLAGPMSGYPEHNYPAFRGTADALRAAGYDVANPANNTPDDTSWDGYVRAGLRQLLGCDGVALLPQWAASAGAQLEVHIAHALRMPCLPFDVWEEKGRPVLTGERSPVLGGAGSRRAVLDWVSQYVVEHDKITEQENPLALVVESSVHGRLVARNGERFAMTTRQRLVVVDADDDVVERGAP